ncbi:hypothetical protein DFP72DRAFT_354197 [Ephemerocybe angulata]|uniref:F-box domain-containing protein n=1 Tax=Ephemerocybe angulata TaxID=980116 RepID=A0A8H6M8A8_9AGAR|nr:hypothetical protein DFP72DRAFT_354197 [Tulosesus angulatus]
MDPSIPSPSIPPMRYSRLASTNDPPSTEEADAILKSYRLLIVNRHKFKLALGFDERLETYRAIRAPIRRLPMETLGVILGFAARDYKGLIRGDWLAAFCRVSRSWWEAAKSMHSLWNDVCIDRYKPLYNDVATWLGRSGTLPKTLRVKLQSNDGREDLLCCKDDHLIGLGYTYADKNPDDDNGDEDAAESTGTPDGDDDDEYSDLPPDSECILVKIQLAKLLLEGPPVDTLMVTFKSSRCLRELFRSIKFQAISKGISWPGIRRLVLRMDGEAGVWVEGRDPSASMFKYLPSRSLSSLSMTLIGDTHWDYNHPINIPPSILNNLTSLKIATDLGGPQIATLLPHCERLEHLDIDYFASDQTWTQEPDCLVKRNLPPRIHLPNLLSLRVVRIPEKVAGTVLHFLHVPALVSLTIDEVSEASLSGPWLGFGRHSERDENRSSISHIFLQSLGLFSSTPGMAANLQSLAIGSREYWRIQELTVAALEDIALHLISLKRLVLVRPKGNDEPFLALCRRMEDQKTHLLPRLEHLEIIDPDSKFPLEPVLQFVRSHHEHRARSSMSDIRPYDSSKMLLVLRIFDTSDQWDTYKRSRTVRYLRKTGISVQVYPAYYRGQ